MMKIALLIMSSALAISWLSMPVYAQGGDWDKIGLQTKKTFCEPDWSIGSTKCPQKPNEAAAAQASARKKRR